MKIKSAENKMQNLQSIIIRQCNQKGIVKIKKSPKKKQRALYISCIFNLLMSNLSLFIFIHIRIIVFEEVTKCTSKYAQLVTR